MNLVADTRILARELRKAHESVAALSRQLTAMGTRSKGRWNWKGHDKSQRDGWLRQLKLVLTGRHRRFRRKRRK